MSRTLIWMDIIAVACLLIFIGATSLDLWILRWKIRRVQRKREEVRKQLAIASEALTLARWHNDLRQ